MAGTTIRRKGELVRGVFSILRKHREGLQVRLVLQELEAAVPPTEFELESYESTPNTRRYEKVVQCDTNMSLCQLSEKLEPQLEIPILGINAVVLWYALRENGFATSVDGAGMLLREH